MRRAVIALVLAFGALLWLPPTASAQKRWGAVAVGPEGSHGHATNFWTEREAEAAAIENCEDKCTAGFVFYDSCGAIVLSGEEAFSGKGATQAAAEAQAIAFCEADKAEGCEVVVWACTEQ